MTSVIAVPPSHQDNHEQTESDNSKEYQQKLLDEANLNFLRNTVVLDVFGHGNKISAKQMNRINDGLNQFYDSIAEHCAENNSEILAHCVKIMKCITYESPESISHKFFEYAFKFTNYLPEVPNEWSKTSWAIIIDTFNDVYNMINDNSIDDEGIESDSEDDIYDDGDDDSEEGSE